MSNINIKIEFMAGTCIKGSFIEARDLARRMCVAYVCYDFNGISCSIGQDADIDYCMAQYKENKKYICAS